MIGAYTNEHAFKKEVIDRMKPMGWLMQEHEDMYKKFIPDLSFAAHGKEGWIEVKYLKTQPKSLNDIKHYTIGQQEWLIERGMRGCGHCYLLVGVQDRGIFLWKWSTLRQVRKDGWADAVVMADAHGGLEWVLRQLDAVVRRRGRG